MFCQFMFPKLDDVQLKIRKEKITYMEKYAAALSVSASTRSLGIGLSVHKRRLFLFGNTFWIILF